MSSWVYRGSIELQSAGSYTLLGIYENGDAWLEVYFDETDDYHWERVNIFSQQREEIRNTPPDLKGAVLPKLNPSTAYLNYTGARWRGLIAQDRIQDTTQELTVAEKMYLCERYRLPVAPPFVIGVAYSYVNANVQLDESRWGVCREFRIAYRLPTPKKERDGTLYDYDTLRLQVFHAVKLGETPTLLEALNGFETRANLVNPKDCLKLNGKLVLLDALNIAGHLHVWE